MYVRNGIRLRHLFRDSWRFLLATAVWAAIVLVLHAFIGIIALQIPIEPVTTIGIAVSLYLGFKTTSAYSRWWEARQLWGDVVIRSRDWANHVFNLIYAEDGPAERADQVELIERHLAWVNALAYQLRQTTRLKRSHTTRIFDHRREFSDAHFHQTPDSYIRHLSAWEADEIGNYANVAAQLLRRQGDRLRELSQAGFLDNYRHVKMMSLLGDFYDAQGKCERIKNTPFPRQIANFGRMFTWLFIFLLPLAFVDIFDFSTQTHNMSAALAHDFMITMIPFTVLISWVFFVMEKVSDSVEDPFEGGANDVPISSLCRIIEIDLRQMIDVASAPEPLKPIDGVLY